MELSLLNGQEGQVPLSHRALSYGDGIFETLRFSAAGLEYSTQHFARLFAGAQRLKLRWTQEQQQKLIEQVQCYLSGLQSDHVVKISLLRHFPGRGYGFDPQTQQTDVIIQVSPYQKAAWHRQGADIRLAQTCVSENASLAGLKHCNRLDSVLARAEYSNCEANEVWLGDRKGRLVEGSMSNLFLHLGGRWVTPTLEAAGVNGIIRQEILKRFDFSEQPIDKKELTECNAAFICNSLIGVVPVKSVDGRAFIQHPDITAVNEEIFIRA